MLQSLDDKLGTIQTVTADQKGLLFFGVFFISITKINAARLIFLKKFEKLTECQLLIIFG